MFSKSDLDSEYNLTENMTQSGHQNFRRGHKREFDEKSCERYASPRTIHMSCSSNLSVPSKTKMSVPKTTVTEVPENKKLTDIFSCNFGVTEYKPFD